MKKRDSKHEVITLNLKSNEAHYQPFVDDVSIEQITIRENGVAYQVKIVENFKTVTDGKTDTKNSVVRLHIKTKCLVLISNKDTEVELTTLK